MSLLPTTVRLVPPVRGALVLAAGLLLAGAGLAGCAGGKSAGPAAAAQTSAAGPRSQGLAGPAAFGVLAEIDGHVLQVQNPTSGQVSVSYSTGTTFSQTKQVTVAALKVGDCVTAVGQRTSGSPSSSGGASRPTSFPAASVEISAPVNGSCGFAGRGGRPGGFPSGRPSGFPSGRPSGGFGGFGDFATGTVSTLDAGSMTVRTPARGQQASSTVTVTLTGSTSYTETVSATAAALRVGECVSATGQTGSTGAVAASRIALSPAGPTGCSTGGFGRRPGANASASSTGA